MKRCLATGLDLRDPALRDNTAISAPCGTKWPISSFTADATVDQITNPTRRSFVLVSWEYRYQKLEKQAHHLAFSLARLRRDSLANLSKLVNLENSSILQ